MSVPAWQILVGLLSLASAARSGSVVAFGWIRDTGCGPVKVIAAGQGLCADDDGTAPVGEPSPVPLGYPAGAMGRALPPGDLAVAFTALPYWMPVAVTPDALLAEPGDGPGGAGMFLEDGMLPAWRKPFGWLVLAAPAGRDRRAELIGEASLAQLMAERHDSPRAKQSALRSRARHDELRQAATLGLWDICLLAGAATRPGAARVAGLLCASLDLGNLPFGLTEQDRCGPLPELLGAEPEAPPAPEPGPVARDVLGMYGGQDPRPGTVHYDPHAAAPPGPGRAPDQADEPWPAPGPSRWTPSAAPAPAPARPQFDDDGVPTWAPAQAPGWGPAAGRTGSRPAWMTEGEPSAAQPAGNGLTPDFPDPEPEFPVAASSRLLAALAVPPAREIPGIRMTLRPSFDVSPETGAWGDGGTVVGADGAEPGAIALGTVLDASRVPSSALSLPRSSLNRHTFVCGATGAGKSQTVRHLLESATGAGIPWLVIEPAKAEYRLMAARLPDAGVITIRPGDLDAVPAGINPLEPAAGPGGKRFPLQAHADLVRALFLAAFRADEPFPQVLAAALTRCYAEAGWDMLTGEPAVPGSAYPTLGDLQAAALKVVEEIGYSREITDNVRGFVSVRIGSLRSGTTGGFLDGGFPLDYSRVLSGNVVLEIEDCGDDSDKAFLTGAILVRLTEHLRMRARAEGPAAPGLRHLTVIEEAHRLLRQPADGEGGGPAAHAVEMFAGLLAEIRAYGEGLIVAEQIPSKLIPDAIKNTAIKIVHRLPAKDDRDSVGATMNLTGEQSRFLVTLLPGEAAVFTDGMDYPVLAKMPDGTGRETAAKIRSGKTGGLVSARSPACPPGCRAAACTLGQVAAARRARARDPRFALWAELSVLAHLTGWPAPEPSAAFARVLAGLDERERDCALAHAVEDAAASRRSALVPRVDPAALAGHVAAAMRAVLSGGPRCPRDEEEWLAPAYEWNLVLAALGDGIRRGSSGRHPDSDRWEQAHGRRIPGGDCAAQLAEVTAWRERARADRGRRAATIFGTATPPALETALQMRRNVPGWRDRVEDAVAVTFTGEASVWAPDFLAPRAVVAEGDPP